MSGLIAIVEKELADHFSSRRFFILFGLIFLTGLSSSFVAGQSIRSAVGENPSLGFVFLLLLTASTGNLPSFMSFMNFLGPLVGLALGFDAINSERNSGTLSRVLAQPVFRDAVINAKFLAGLLTIAVMLVSIVLMVSGMGLRITGIPPSLDEALRVLAFLAVTILFMSFWMSVAVLYSTLFRQAATSALAGIATWIFFAFFMPIIARLVAAIWLPAGPEPDPLVLLMQSELSQAVSRLSPNTLYLEATAAVLSPDLRTLGWLQLFVREIPGLMPTPLPLSQSLLVVWPHLAGLVALTLVCFAASYVRFLREEIRA